MTWDKTASYGINLSLILTAFKHSMFISLKVKRRPLSAAIFNMSGDSGEKQRERNDRARRGHGAFSSRNLLKKSSIVFPLRCDSTVLVSGPVTYCMMSVLFNWSEVIFFFFFQTWWRFRSRSSSLGSFFFLRRSSPASHSHTQTPQGPFPPAPRG